MRTDMVAGGGPALFRLVRFWSRRWAAGITHDEGRDVGHILVLEAVDAARGDGRSAQIAAVAVELGLDRSNASRMLTSTVTAGLLTRTVSAHDARRTELELTAAGEALLSAARTWQEQAFARMVADWPAQDARRFASYLVRLADSTSKHREGAS